MIPKFYGQRYRLFSKYDQGIRITDDEAWFSVTPEEIARNIADKCRKFENSVIIDAFCGVGGNAIQFALLESCKLVIAVEIDSKKIEDAKSNAKIYGVYDKIKFICGDFLELVNDLRALNPDVCFLSPPWGGMEYTDTKYYSLSQIKPCDGFKLFGIARSLTENVIYFLPRNLNLQDLFSLTQTDHVDSNEDSNEFELEMNYLNEKLKTITVYFGNAWSSPESLL